MSFLDLLSESDLEEMQACFHPVRFAKGECLLHEDESLLGLRVRARGGERPDAPLVLMGIAVFGWAAAGIAVAGLFLSRRRRWPWPVLPVLAAGPYERTSSRAG
jgi:hypothetical protein